MNLRYLATAATIVGAGLVGSCASKVENLGQGWYQLNFDPSKRVTLFAVGDSKEPTLLREFYWADQNIVINDQFVVSASPEQKRLTLDDKLRIQMYCPENPNTASLELVINRLNIFLDKSPELEETKRSHLSCERGQ